MTGDTPNCPPARAACDKVWHEVGGGEEDEAKVWKAHQHCGIDQHRLAPDGVGQPAQHRCDKEAYEIRARVYEGADLCSPGRVVVEIGNLDLRKHGARDCRAAGEQQDEGTQESPCHPWVAIVTTTRLRETCPHSS